MTEFLIGLGVVAVVVSLVLAYIRWAYRWKGDA